MTEKNVLVVTEGGPSFDAAVEAATDDQDFRARLQRADVLMLSVGPYMDHEGPLFPAVTRDLYRFMNRDGSPVVMEIATEDDNPPQLILHGALVVLGIILVTHVVAPAAIGLLVNFIHEHLKKRRAKPEDSTVRCTLIVDNEGKTKTLEYDGPASTFEKMMQQRIGSGETDAP